VTSQLSTPCPLGCAHPEVEWQFPDRAHSIKRCLGCSVVFVHPRLSHTGVDSLYNDSYFEKYKRLPAMGYVNASASKKKMVEYLRRAFSLCKSIQGAAGTLLDVGCGTGRFIEVAQEENWAVAGLELFSGVAEETARRLGIKVTVGSILEADLPAHSFDVITMFDVIEHVEEPVLALQSCARMLKPGGVLVLTTPNFNGLGRRLVGKNAFAIWPDEHLVYFKPSTLRRALALAGFGRVELGTRDIYPENVAMFLSRLRGREETISSRPAGTEESVLFVKTIARGRALAKVRSLTNSIFAHLRWGDELLAFAIKA
jgi:2-polyprenyl-3-methyl-5-hydroxy-6-metoxy-1,4-benzoquinol methylase